MRRLALLALVLLAFPALAPAQVGGEFESLEAYVAGHPEDVEGHRQLAAGYAASGFIEEAMAQYVALLQLSALDREARAAAAELLATRMPVWLPGTTAKVEPFPLETFRLTVTSPRTGDEAFLITTAGLVAHEGENVSRLHGSNFPRVAYGYCLDRRAGRWKLRVRVHYTEAQAELAQAALRTTLALYGIARGVVGLDPAKKAPLDIWLCEDGPPGALSTGTSIYLLAVNTERVPEEWLRELAHEYGHAALPGIGGFSKTDDPWADGELGELLFVKWLAAAQVDWVPWPVAAAEATARARREELMSRAAQPDAKLLAGLDAKARDHFLGLALRVEDTAGPKFLAEVLSQCPHGTAGKFVAQARKLAKARGVRVW